MAHIVTLTEQDFMLLRMIVADADAQQAMEFLKRRVLKPLEESMRKGMDTGKGHL